MAKGVRLATNGDVDRMLDLADEKRGAYITGSGFHRPAPDARQAQRPWFEELILNEDVATLVYEEDRTVSGFIIGSLIQAPPVYEPGA
jgi:hypothetical protein